MRRIAAVTGSRADYAIQRSVFWAIERYTELKLSLVVTGLHLSDEFGSTVDEIKKDGFEIGAKIDVLNRHDNGSSMAIAVGNCVIQMVNAIENLAPGILCVFGDRWEMLAASVAATYMRLPIAHMSGATRTASCMSATCGT